MSGSLTTMRRPLPPAVSGDRRRWWALVVIALGQLMVVFDVTIVNVALPSIGRSLKVAGGHQWVITAYTLAFAGLLLVGGRAADRLGRKRAFLIALAGFAATSALGAAAPNLGTLVAARAGQGMFGALLAPTALSLVATTFPDPAERARAFTVFGMVMGGGSGVGLVLGGLLTEYLGWRWVLLINTPLALVALLGALLVLTESRGGEHGRIDLLSAALGTTGLIAVVYGFSAATAHGWAAPLTWGTLTAGVAVLVAFVVAQARMRHPLLPLQIVTDRSRGGAYLTFVLVMVAMFGMFLLVSFYLQTVAGHSPLRAGLGFLPFAAAVLVASLLVGRVMTRIRAGLILAAGLLLAAAGMGALTQLAVDSHYAAQVLPAVVLIGLGIGTVSPVAANLAGFGVPERSAGTASAVFNVSEQVGASIGLAVLSTIAATSTHTYLATRAPSPAAQLAGLVHGYTTATVWAAAILCAGAVMAAVLVNARLGAAPDSSPAGTPVTNPASAPTPATTATAA